MQYLKMMTSSASRYVIGSVWVLSFLICLPAFLADAEHSVAAAILESSGGGVENTELVQEISDSQYQPAADVVNFPSVQTTTSTSRWNASGAHSNLTFFQNTSILYNIRV